MGASNIAAAYARYAGKVPPLSMQVLVYMALISIDEDRHPWYGMGHHALAEMALGRPAPITPADIRAVERAIAPLAKVGAIATDRRGAIRKDGPNTVRYRLNLRGAQTTRIPSGVRAEDIDADHAAATFEDPPHPTECGADTRRNPTAHPTETVATPDGFRGTEDLGGARRSDKTEEEHLSVDTDLAVAREDGSANKPDFSAASPQAEPPPAAGPPAKCHHGLKSGTRPDGRLACTLCYVESTRVADPPPDPEPPPNGGGPPADVRLADVTAPLDDPLPVGAAGPQLRVLQGGLAA